MTTNHSHPLVHQVAQAWPPAQWRGCHLLVALSGGADSVALLRAMVELQTSTEGSGKLMAVHFNHCLRSDDADADENWVRALCDQLCVPLHVGRTDAAATLTSEEQARNARYAFFVQTAEATGARFVVTGHTADDQVETLLMRILRGSGVAGLAGIPFSRALTSSVTLLRPLLAIRREAIEKYLAKLKQPFRIDATNDQTNFTRNWIRGELLPLVRDRLTGDVDQALLRLTEQAGEWRSAIDQLVDYLTAGAIDVTPETITLNATKLTELPAIVLQEASRRAWRAAGWPEQAMGMAEWQRIATAIPNEDLSPFILPGNVQVRRDGGSVVLTLQ